jgi:hypothetical protein
MDPLGVAAMWFALWVFFRLAKWLSWIGLLGLTAWIVTHRAEVVNQFGHPRPEFELPIFALIIAAGFAGMLELMAREKAGYVRPDPFQLLPPRATPQSRLP